MAYVLKGKTYSEHSLMDEIIHGSKIILNSIVLKNCREADENETEESMLQSDYLMAIHNGSMDLYIFPLTKVLLIKFGYTDLQARKILADVNNVPEGDKEDLLKFCIKDFLANYVEYNNYYRTLNGLPDYGTTEFDVYVDPTDERLLLDDFNTDFDFSKPIHEYSIAEINTLDSLGIIKSIRESHPGSKYKYLDFLGAKRIDYQTARAAANWDILYIPNVEYLIKSRFKELYTLNRDIYQLRTYQEAYKYQSDYYDEMIMIMIIAQTFADMVVDVPEWYIRRDVFDLRTVQYFLESQGVKFFKEIPLKFQIRIVKNLNKLIRYKSTTKNIHDILEIFAVEGTTVYKYYLFKKYLYTDHTQKVIEPEVDPIWKMDDEYDFGYEDTWEGILDTTGFEVYNFLDENVEDFDTTLPVHMYDFGNDSSDVPPISETTDYLEEEEEAKKIIVDEYGNVYELEFVRVPIDEAYDDYIKDNINREDYDVVTRQDKYWDGQDIHSYVKNKHLEKDFTIEGTKYMFLDYKVSMSEYRFQMSYFMNMLLTSKTNTEDITIAVPSIRENTVFALSDLCIFMCCLSEVYNNKNIQIKQPIIKTKAKPAFKPYWDINGGMFFDGDQPVLPETPEPDPEWEMDHEYDFGFENVDKIVYDPLYGEMYDFGYHSDVSKEDLRVYEFGEIKVTSIDYTLFEEPTAGGWLMGNLYDFLSETPGYIEPVEDNYVGDNPDYDFRDEYIAEPLVLTDYSKIYDFRSENNVYVDYEEPAPPIYEPPVENWWDNEVRHPFDIEINGQRTKCQDMYRINVNGGLGVRYTEVNQETFYEWMRSDHPNWFVPKAGKIYGYNLQANLEELESEINERHSAFGFKHGYTLADFGCDNFITTDNISTIEDLLKVYRNNAKCYEALKNMIVEDLDTRDKMVTANYVFDTLFTIPFDSEFYRLKNGDIASSYDQILRQRNYTLYREYINIISETDVEVRKDNIREVLNNIVATLDYYLKADDTKYVLSFVPTNSFESIVNYIQLMVNFFKSWKVYFLDPHVSYVLDDKKENKVGYGDQIVEFKPKLWYQDTGIIADALQIKPVLIAEERNAGMSYEMIDMYAYYQSLVTEDLYFDGGFANDGSRSRIKIDYEDINGGNVSKVTCSPFLTVNGGIIGARKDLYDLDGGGAIDMQEYLDIDGLSCTDTNHVMDNSFNISSYDIDGGYVAPKLVSTNTISTSVEDNTIRSEVILSKYNSNGIVVNEDGLYLGGDFASRDEFDQYKYAILSDRYNYEDELNEYINRVKLFGTEELLDYTIGQIFTGYFTVSKEVLSDYNRNISLNYVKQYTYNKAAELREWFTELDVFGWSYF